MRYELSRLHAAFARASVGHLIVDMQQDTCNPGHPTVRSMTASHRLLAPRIDDFVAQTRGDASPIYSVHRPQRWHPTPVTKATPGTAAYQADVRAYCLKNLYGQSPAPEDQLFTKPLHSAFDDTRLEAILETKNIDTLLISGTVLGDCIRATVSKPRPGLNLVLIDDLIGWKMASQDDIRTYIDRQGWRRVSSSDVIAAATKPKVTRRPETPQI